MKTTLFIFFTISINCFFSATAQEEDVQLISVEKLKKDLLILKQNLYEVHPGLHAYHSKEKMDSLFNEINQDIKGPQSSLVFYRSLLPLLKLIANNHTNIKCAITYENALLEELPRLPFRLYPKDGKLFVHEDLSDEQSIGLGKEILSINGVNSNQIINDLISLRSPDGFNVSLSLTAIGIAFSRYYAYYYGTTNSYKISFLQNDGTTKNVTINGLKATILNAKRENQNLTKQKEFLQFSIADNTGYLRIPSFQPKSAPFYRKKLKQTFAELQEKKVKNLVIDVRHNGGGYGEAVTILLSYLIKRPIFQYKDEYALVDKIPYPQYYEKDMFFKHFKKQPLVKKGQYYHIKNIESQEINPKKIAFKNDIYILMNGASASATGEFLGLAKSYTNAVFIGQESGGNPAETTANDLLHMTLPNSKIRVTIPALRTFMNVTFENTGHGVKPDYEIIPSIEDILAKKDVVLKFVNQKIKKNQKTEE